MVLLFWFAAIIKGVRTFNDDPAVVPSTGPRLPDKPPRLSVLIPARNEEGRIGKTVESLLSQDYPDFEVIVLDDRSTDRTMEILEQYSRHDDRLRVVPGRPLPARWFGKPHAVTQAAEKASGDYFLMTDADTIHAPGSLRAAMAHLLRNRLDLLSLLPRLQCLSFWEKLLMPQLGSLLLHRRPLSRVNDPNDEMSFGNGQYMLVKASVFDDVGGLASVKSDISEDVGFARLVQKRGFRYQLARGEAVFSTRMYASLGEIFRGFGKNAYATMGYNPLRALSMALTVLLLSLAPLAMLLYTILALTTATPPPTIIIMYGFVQYAVVLSFQISVRAMGRMYPHYSILAPLGGLLTALLLVWTALWHHAGRGVSWKGRTYSMDDK